MPSTRASPAPAPNTTATSAISGTSQAQSPPRATCTRLGIEGGQVGDDDGEEEADDEPEADRHGRSGAAALAGGGALFLFDRALAVDAVARERQRLEALVGDGSPQRSQSPKPPSSIFCSAEHDFLQQPAVAVAQLEEELAVVGRTRPGRRGP